MWLAMWVKRSERAFWQGLSGLVGDGLIVGSELKETGVEKRARCATIVSTNAGVAQVVEHLLPKQRVAGSNPVARFENRNFAHPLTFALRPHTRAA